MDFDRDCGSSGCSVSAITNYTQRVGDGRLSATNTNQALMFLVHFVGDITQPLHDEAYEVGGNDVDVTYQGKQLHGYQRKTQKKSKKKINRGTKDEPDVDDLDN